ncbi:MAG: hypothetical protein Q9193_003928 [Seirophora villosa]
MRDTERDYDQYTMDTSREGQGSPGPASRQMESQQPSEPEPATPIDSNNDTPTSSKMPGTLAIDDHEDYLSSSSGEISESASHEPVDTVRPEAEQGEQRQQTHENPETSHEEHESLPPPSDIHGLPRHPSDDTTSHIILPPAIQQIPGPAAIRQTSLSSRSGAQIRRYGRIDPMRLLENRRHAYPSPLQVVLKAKLTFCSNLPGLTADHPTLTTYFEGEIIGPKYTFQTRHPSWGATDKTDMQHWARFPAWRPLAKQAKKPDFHYKNFAQRENIFMRWKESFLVPDHRVREISGASFEGFYYICFNQVSGDINGIYFHAKSEKYQQLELKHVPDRGCFPAMEFR